MKLSQSSLYRLEDRVKHDGVMCPSHAFPWTASSLIHFRSCSGMSPSGPVVEHLNGFIRVQELRSTCAVTTEPILWGLCPTAIEATATRSLRTG